MWVLPFVCKEDAALYLPRLTSPSPGPPSSTVLPGSGGGAAENSGLPLKEHLSVSWLKQCIFVRFPISSSTPAHAEVMPGDRRRPGSVRGPQAPACVEGLARAGPGLALCPQEPVSSGPGRRPQLTYPRRCPMAKSHCPRQPWGARVDADGLPGAPGVGNLPAPAGHTGWTPGLGGPHVLRGS